ncbi:hypothetical protein [Methanosarcina vacuolata]|uniref:hypothetical protein n=1 Tax=Methanosarcina vacuolata TaxID=2215 RepID=UPI0012F6B43A|nr:hypothetical protein [Methanosarcina vacuolata]
MREGVLREGILKESVLREGVLREGFFGLHAKQIITGKAIHIPETNFDRDLGRWKEK